MHFDLESSIEGRSTDRPPASEPPVLRLVRAQDGPTVSVVLATRRTRAELVDALPPLVLACSQPGVDLIIASAENIAHGARATSRHVKHLIVPADASTSQMRMLAMGQVTGDIVVLLDDVVASPSLWVDRVRSVIRRATSPSVDDPALAGRAPIDWRSYLNRVSAPQH